MTEPDNRPLLDEPTPTDQPTGAASADSTPADPRVTRMESLYEAGDFRALGEDLGGLPNSESGPVRDKASELRSRLELDRFVLGAWVGAALLVSIVIYLYVLEP